MMLPEEFAAKVLHKRANNMGCKWLRRKLCLLLDHDWAYGGWTVHETEWCPQSPYWSDSERYYKTYQHRVTYNETICHTCGEVKRTWLGDKVVYNLPSGLDIEYPVPDTVYGEDREEFREHE